MLKQINSLFRKSTPKIGAVLVAAGTSSRMKGVDKIMVPLAGEPLILHTIRAFQQNDAISQIVVVTRKELCTELADLCNANQFHKVTTVVVGGATRPESVMHGLDLLSKDTQYAAIHDGARPLITQEIIDTTIEKALHYHAAAPAVPVKDTIKIAENHIVTQTPERAKLFAIQTPQIFDFDLLRGALQKAITEQLPITDDCSAVEALGMSIYLSDGSDENMKVTTPIDLTIAEAILRNRRSL